MGRAAGRRHYRRRPDPLTAATPVGAAALVCVVCGLFLEAVVEDIGMSFLFQPVDVVVHFALASRARTFFHAEADPHCLYGFILYVSSFVVAEPIVCSGIDRQKVRTVWSAV